MPGSASGSTRISASNQGLQPPLRLRDHIAQYLELGYAIIPGVFSASEVASLRAACDWVHHQADQHPASFRHKNLHYRIAQDANLGKVVRMAQWAAYDNPVLERCRRDPRILDILEPLLGNNLKQIINQIHWKPPGAAQADFCYHQDIRFRRPREAYRNTRTCYMQTAIAIDPHHEGNGALRVYPGSHRMPELKFSGDSPVMESALTDRDLEGLGLDPAKIVTLELAPGDFAFWNLYTIHGSGPNFDGADSRLVYLNSYVRAEDCDRGEWAFKGGRPVRLGEPVLVHYEDLYRRPEPHYLDAKPVGS